MERKRILIGNILLPPVGYLFSQRDSYVSAAAFVLFVMVLYQAFSYASLSNLEEAVARLGLRLRDGWQWVWLLKTHWFFATPFGFVIPMKVLYVAVIVHSIRLAKRVPVSTEE